jgi:hypothetical protein
MPLCPEPTTAQLTALRNSQQCTTAALQGCHVVFTRCWPMSEQHPERQQLWQTAEALGATCSTAYTSGITTHVVAAAPKTQKAAQAAADGVPVVTPKWLGACRTEWRRVEEEEYSHEAGGRDKSKGGSGQVEGAVDEVAAAMAAAGGGAGAGAEATGVGGREAGAGAAAAGEPG